MLPTVRFKLFSEKNTKLVPDDLMKFHNFRFRKKCLEHPCCMGHAYTKYFFSQNSIFRKVLQFRILDFFFREKSPKRTNVTNETYLIWTPSFINFSLSFIDSSVGSKLMFSVAFLILSQFRFNNSNFFSVKGSGSAFIIFSNPSDNPSQ